MKKAKYIKPAISLLGMDLCNVVCGSGEYANWGNGTKGNSNWVNQGQTPTKPTDTGIGVGEDEGVIDSRSKKHSWNLWDE